MKERSGSASETLDDVFGRGSLPPLRVFEVTLRYGTSRVTVTAHSVNATPEGLLFFTLTRVRGQIVAQSTRGFGFGEWISYEDQGAVAPASGLVN